LFVWLLAIASTAAAIFGPKILGKATTTLFEGVMAQLAGTGSVDFTTIGKILLQALLLYVFSATLSFAQGWIMTGVAMKITYRFRKDIAEKINHMPLKYFDGTNHGEVLSRVTNDVDTVSQTLNQSLTQIITSVTMLIGILVMMFTISWQMTLVALGTLPLSFGILGLIMSKSQVYFKRRQDYLGHINGHVEEMYGGHVVVKAFNGEAKSVEYFDQINTTLFDSAWKSEFLTGLLFPIMNFVGNLGYVAICVLGGYLVVKGTMPIGDIQAFIQYMRSFTRSNIKYPTGDDRCSRTCVRIPG
jgi:ATP-binding cassette subfamily B protein